MNWASERSCKRMIVIRLEDVKKWRAQRIQGGQCNFDDMQALGAFLENVEKIEMEEKEIENGEEV